MSNALKRFPNFHWTFSTLGCPELSLEACCQLAKRYGSPSIEARTLDGTANLPDLFERQFGSPKQLAKFIESEGVSIVFLDTSLKLIGNDEASRAQFLQFLPWAEALEVKWLRVFDGGQVVESLSEENMEEGLNTIEWWKEEKKRFGWSADMAFETHDSLVYATARDQLQENANQSLNFIWDSHHTWKKSTDSLLESWNQIKGHTVNVHIKDSISEPSARHPYTYVQLGEGEFPLEETLGMLEHEGYEGSVSIEWERQWHPYMPPLETALSRAQDMNWF